MSFQQYILNIHCGSIYIFVSLSRSYLVSMSMNSPGLYFLATFFLHSSVFFIWTLTALAISKAIPTNLIHKSDHDNMLDMLLGRKSIWSLAVLRGKRFRYRTHINVLQCRSWYRIRFSYPSASWKMDPRYNIIPIVQYWVLCDSKLHYYYIALMHL